MVRPFSLDPFLCQWGWWENKERFDQKQIPKVPKHKKTFRFLFALHHIIIEIFTFLCLRISFPSFSLDPRFVFPLIYNPFGVKKSVKQKKGTRNESPEKSVLRRSSLFFISLEKFHFFLGAAKIVQKSLGSYRKKKKALFGQMYMNMTVWEELFLLSFSFFPLAPS